MQATVQLSPRAATSEPMHSRAHVLQLERSPQAATKTSMAKELSKYLKIHFDFSYNSKYDPS